MTTIYLVRHGQASFGKSNYDELSENGEAQATLLGQYFKQILKEQPYVVAGTMQRHEQTAKLALNECFPDAVIHHNNLWNEFNHQQVFARYEPRFEQPELLKADVAKSITLARILPKSLKVRLNDGPTAIFIMNMMSLGHTLKKESKRHYSNFVMS